MTIGDPIGAPGVLDANAPSPKTDIRLVKSLGIDRSSTGASAAAVMTGMEASSIVPADNV